MSHLKIGESKVIESRESQDGTMIRRRRVSLDGKHRFTTYERIERPGMMVRKRSGSREAFDREKLMKAVRNSVGKYFDSDLDVQNIVDKVEELIYERGKDEIPSSLIGETILEVLSDTNEMAYVRFASVFKEFKTLDDLERSIMEQRERIWQLEREGKILVLLPEGPVKIATAEHEGWPMLELYLQGRRQAEQRIDEIMLEEDLDLLLGNYQLRFHHTDLMPVLPPVHIEQKPEEETSKKKDKEKKKNPKTEQRPSVRRPSSNYDDKPLSVLKVGKMSDTKEPDASKDAKTKIYQ